jgi:hypothetical protein
MGSMARAAYGETLRCERCFTPYKVVGADRAPQKRLLCNECGYAQDVIIIERAEPVTRWTLVEPNGTVRSFATQDELLEAVRTSGVRDAAPEHEPEPETPREPPPTPRELPEEEAKTARLEIVESAPDVTEKLRDDGEVPEVDPGEYVSISEVVVAPLVTVPSDPPPPAPDVPPARVSAPPPLPADLLPKLGEALDASPETPPEITSLSDEDLDSDPPPSARALSVPPPLPKKKSEPPPASQDRPSRLTKTVGDERSDEELIADAVSVAPSVPPPDDDEERVNTDMLLLPSKRIEVPPRKSEPPPLPKKSVPPAPAAKKSEVATTQQSRPKLPSDEAAVARQAPQPEAQQRSLLLPLLAIGLLSVGAWYLWAGSKAGEATGGATAPTTSTTAAAPTTPASVTASVPRLVVSAMPPGSASAAPSASVAHLRPFPMSMPELLSAAATARKNGDNAAARDLYHKVLAQNASNVEANAGIGAIARAEGDLATARASYEKALATSPGFYPAIIGLADTEWDLGDRAAAQVHYQAILKMPNTPPERVRERAGVAESKPAPPPPAPMTTSAPPDNDRVQ